MVHHAGSLTFDVLGLIPGLMDIRDGHRSDSGLSHLPCTQCLCSLQSWGPHITLREGPITWIQKLFLFPLSPSPRPALVPWGSQQSGVPGACRTRTFQAHAHRQALLEAAEGTALTLRLVDFAALTFGARVMFVVLDCALEEALLQRKGVSTRSRPSAASRTPAARSLPHPCSRFALTLQLSHVSSP